MLKTQRDCCGFHQRNGKPHCKQAAFSRLSALRKRKEADPVTVEEEENISEDHLFEQNLRCEVYEALDLQHPLSFEDRNICKISKGGKSWN